MICRNCGKEIKDGMMFCPGCGNLLGNENEGSVQTESAKKQEQQNTDSIQYDNVAAATAAHAESPEQYAGSQRLSDQGRATRKVRYPG